MFFVHSAFVSWLKKKHETQMFSISGKIRSDNITETKMGDVLYLLYYKAADIWLSYLCLVSLCLPRSPNTLRHPLSLSRHYVTVCVFLCVTSDRCCSTYLLWIAWPWVPSVLCLGLDAPPKAAVAMGLAPGQLHTTVCQSHCSSSGFIFIGGRTWDLCRGQ